MIYINFCVIFFLFPIVTIEAAFIFKGKVQSLMGISRRKKQQQLIHSIKACHVTAEPWHYQQQTTNVPKTARCIREIKCSFLLAKAPTWTDEERAWMLLEEVDAKKVVVTTQHWAVIENVGLIPDLCDRAAVKCLLTLPLGAKSSFSLGSLNATWPCREICCNTKRMPAFPPKKGIAKS